MLLLLTATLCAAPLQEDEGRGLLKVGDHRPRRPGLERALEIAQFGFPEEESLDSLLASMRDSNDTWEAALLGAGALVPATLPGAMDLAPEEKERAFSLVLDALMEGPRKIGSDSLFARAAPWMGAAEAEALVDRLLAGDFPGRRAALSLLEAGLAPEVNPAILRFVLESRGDTHERLRFIQKLVLWQGPGSLEILSDILEPDSPDLLARVFFQSWRPMANVRHLPKLWEIALGGNKWTAQTALQVLAPLETSDKARMELFDRILEMGERNRQTILDQMVLHVPDPLLEGRLFPLLDSADRDLRALSRLMLPRVAGPEKAFAEFKSRVGENLPLARQSGWMVALARLDWAPARETAAAWLASGGWATGSAAMAVSKSLAGSSAIDPWLGGFLQNPEVSAAITFPLAMARAPYSQEARSFLRQALEGAEGFRQEQAIRGLSNAGLEEDLEVLLLVAQGEEFDAVARVAAFEGLARHSATGPILVEILRQGLGDYQAMEGLVLQMMRHPDPDIRKAGVLAPEQPGLPVEESDALRFAILQEQARFPRESEMESLAQSLVSLLTFEADHAPSDFLPLPAPRALLMEEPLILPTALALSACLQASGFAPSPLLQSLAAEKVPLARLLVICPLLAESESSLPVAQWVGEAAQREGLPPGNRVRALAAWAHAAGLQEDGRRHAKALAFLLAKPKELSAWKADLGYGLRRSGVRGWILPLDRLAERQLLVRAQSLSGQGRLEALRLLVGPPAASFQALVKGSELALACQGGEALAFSLGEIAAGMTPGDFRGWLAAGLAAAGADLPEDAAFHLSRVLWTAPEGSEAAGTATFGLAALGLEPIEF